MKLYFESSFQNKENTLYTKWLLKKYYIQYQYFCRVVYMFLWATLGQ